MRPRQLESSSEDACARARAMIRSDRAGLTFFEALVVLAIVTLVVLFFLPLTRNARAPARRVQCMNNLKHIAVANLNYGAMHKTVPAAYSVDDEGAPLHSWRVTTLPLIEEQELHDSIVKGKPWDDPANAEFAALEISTLLCPSYPEPDAGSSTYLGSFGEDRFFRGATPITRDVLTDGDAKTVMVVDALQGRAVPWMAPRDADDETWDAFFDGAQPSHAGVVPMAFVDGHVQQISVDVDPVVLRALLTTAGGETVDEDAL
jgi:prepilin-type processing-associated H-X9-DG protein